MSRMLGFGGIDVRAAGDVLLEDVVLDGAAELFGETPCSFRRRRTCQQDGSGGVDGHGGGDVVQRDAVEQDLHVLHGVDCDADLADFARGHRVVGVVANLGGKVEGDGEAGLALRQSR